MECFGRGSVCSVWHFARAAVTKHHGADGLNVQSTFSRASGGWRSETEGLVGLVSSEGPKDLCQPPPPTTHDRLLPGSSCARLSLKDTSIVGLEPILMTSFSFRYLFERPICKYSCVLKFLELRLPRVNFWRTPGRLRGSVG